MLKTAAVVFGIVFLAVGVLGFVPGVTTNEMLLGIFHVNAAHNVVHLLSGAVALWAGMTSAANARLYFRIFGVVYAIVAVLGFASGDEPILGIISSNAANTWLHVAIAVVSLVLGFAVKDAAAPAKPAL
jgi:Domain of unknown function (DUF4383)